MQKLPFQHLHDNFLESERSASDPSTFSQFLHQGYGEKQLQSYETLPLLTVLASRQEKQ
jgi:hypothetical protein